MNNGNYEVMLKALLLAIRHAGGQSALAHLVGISPQAVQQWVQAGRVSHKKVRAVATKTGVELEKLRPDLYG